MFSSRNTASSRAASLAATTVAIAALMAGAGPAGSVANAQVTWTLLSNADAATGECFNSVNEHGSVSIDAAKAGSYDFIRFEHVSGFAGCWGADSNRWSCGTTTTNVVFAFARGTTTDQYPTAGSNIVAPGPGAGPYAQLAKSESDLLCPGDANMMIPLTAVIANNPHVWSPPSAGYNGWSGLTEDNIYFRPHDWQTAGQFTFAAGEEYSMWQGEAYTGSTTGDNRSDKHCVNMYGGSLDGADPCSSHIATPCDATGIVYITSLATWATQTPNGAVIATIGGTEYYAAENVHEDLACASS